MCFVINANCQTKMTEGRIVYEIANADTLNNIKADSSKSSEWIFRFKGNKQRTDYIKSENDSSAFIYNNKTYDAASLENKNGIKTAKVFTYKKGGSMIRPVSNETFQYFDDTKNICGYKCYKTKYVYGQDKSIFYVYYSKDIATSMPYDLKIRFRELKGFPMEFNTKTNGKEEITKVVNISSEKINDSIFDIPKDYKIENVEKW